MLITPDHTPAIAPDDETSGPHVGPPAPATRSAPTPDPDAGWWLRHRASAPHLAALPDDAPTPTLDTPPDLDALPLPPRGPVPDLGPVLPDLGALPTSDPPPTSAASALPALVGTLAAPPPGGGPSPLQQLLGVAGGQAIVLVGLVVWALSWMGDRLDASITAALDKRAAVEQLDFQRRALEADRQRGADEAAHAKLHDDEARAVDARLDKLLDLMQRQDAKLDDLAAKLDAAPPRRR